MSGPLGRIIAQVVVMGAGIVSRAFVQAYQQAVHNAKSGNTGAAMAAKTAVRKNAMSKQQALEILNFPSSTKPSGAEIEKQFTRYFEANDPAKGGSFYLQSKIFRAKEALETEEDGADAAAAADDKPKE
jgi:import inner membrane translocase subunit TIM16